MAGERWLTGNKPSESDFKNSNTKGITYVCAGFRCCFPNLLYHIGLATCCHDAHDGLMIRVAQSTVQSWAGSQTGILRVTLTLLHPE